MTTLAPSLALRAAQESAAVLSAAFDRCAVALHRYFAVRTGDVHAADDLMQQLWLQAARGAGGVPGEELEFWLRGVARNLLQTHWRRARARPQSASLPDARLAAELAERLMNEPLPAELLEQREVCDQLLLAITELSAEEQGLIEGYYFAGLSQAELAQRSGLSARAVEGRLYRARRALYERLKNLAP